jgi:hypothetical protein
MLTAAYHVQNVVFKLRWIKLVVFVVPGKGCVSITVPVEVYEKLMERAQREGLSVTTLLYRLVDERSFTPSKLEEAEERRLPGGESDAPSTTGVVESSGRSLDCEAGDVDQPSTQDEAEKYFDRLRTWSSKPDYTDEELLRAIVKEARNDYFGGTGRIFISEFTKWYRCSRERLLNVLEKSPLKWRLDPNGVVVLINL